MLRACRTSCPALGSICKSQLSAELSLPLAQRERRQCWRGRPPVRCRPESSKPTHIVRAPAVMILKSGTNDDSRISEEIAGWKGKDLVIGVEILLPRAP